MGLAGNFLSFRAKKCLGMVLDFEYQVACVYFVCTWTTTKLANIKCITSSNSREGLIAISVLNSCMSILSTLSSWAEPSYLTILLKSSNEIICDQAKKEQNISKASDVALRRSTRCRSIFKYHLTWPKPKSAFGFRIFSLLWEPCFIEAVSDGDNLNYKVKLQKKVSVGWQKGKTVQQINSIMQEPETRKTGCSKKLF